MSLDGSGRLSNAEALAPDAEALGGLEPSGKHGGGNDHGLMNKKSNHRADDPTEDGDDETTLNDEAEELGKPPRREDVTTPPPHISSPSIPSPMSVGTLGFVTPLGQHLAASFTRSPDKSPVDSDGDKDYQRRQTNSSSNGDSPNQSDIDINNGNSTTISKAILAQRLHGLASKLSQSDSFADQATVDLLNGRVDELDRVFVTGQITKRSQPSQKRPQPTSLQQGHEVNTTEARETSSPRASPSSSWMRSRYSDLSSSMSSNSKARESPEKMATETEKEKKPAVDSFKIASEAQKLNAELETLVNNFKARQEESEHIHGLLITRAERAAQRIIFLQSRVRDLESELQESDSDLSHLRLGLKAVEVLCPRDSLGSEDAELAQCIANWKRDYADLKKRRASRRRAAHLAGSDGNELKGMEYHGVDSENGGDDDGRTSTVSPSLHHEWNVSDFGTPQMPPAKAGLTPEHEIRHDEHGVSHVSSSMDSSGNGVYMDLDKIVDFQSPSRSRRRVQPASHRPHSRRGVQVEDGNRHHLGAHYQEQQDEKLTPPRTRSMAQADAAIGTVVGRPKLSSSASKALRRITDADSNGSPPSSRRRSRVPDSGHFNSTHHNHSRSSHSPRLVDLSVLGSPITVKRTGAARAAVGSPLRHHYSQPFYPHYQSAEGPG